MARTTITSSVHASAVSDFTSNRGGHVPKLVPVSKFCKSGLAIMTGVSGGVRHINKMVLLGGDRRMSPEDVFARIISWRRLVFFPWLSCPRDATFDRTCRAGTRAGRETTVAKLCTCLKLRPTSNLGGIHLRFLATYAARTPLVFAVKTCSPNQNFAARQSGDLPRLSESQLPPKRQTERVRELRSGKKLHQPALDASIVLSVSLETKHIGVATSGNEHFQIRQVAIMACI